MVCFLFVFTISVSSGISFSPLLDQMQQEWGGGGRDREQGGCNSCSLASSSYRGAITDPFSCGPFVWVSLEALPLTSLIRNPVSKTLHSQFPVL